MTAVERMKQQEVEADRRLEELQRADASGNTAAPSEEVVATPSATPAPAPAPESSPVPSETVPKAEYDRVKAAYATLQGKFNAEIPRFVQRIDALETELDALKKKSAEPAQPAVPSHLRHVKPEEVQDLNPDAVDVQARMARGVAEEEANKVRGELTPTIDQMKREFAQARETALWNIVEQTYPGARQMDLTDPDWQAFLESEDELTGMTHKSIGIRALAQGNATTIVKLINKYKSAAGNAHTTAPQGDETVLSQLKPATAKTAQSSASSTQKPMLKESDYKRFVDEVTKGLFKNRPERQKELEDQFESAAIEGRLLWGQ